MPILWGFSTQKMKFGKYDVEDELIDGYVDHLNMSVKSPMQKWENTRKELHNKIFETVGVDRFSDEGKKFSKVFDKYCELRIDNINEVFAKRITNAESEEEMEHELKKLEFIKRWQK